MLAKFISNLSHRFRRENDLSDITWTLCRTSKEFQRAFLQFFFPSLGEDCGDVWITRENSKDDSRADFAFEYHGQTYVIENKIGDTNHHFEQYVNAYNIPASHLGYIANYPIVYEGFDTKTWSEFYFYLTKHIPTEDETEAQLWRAYMEYLKDVCGIFVTNIPMNLQGMFSLYTFYRCLDDVFAFDNDLFTSSVYNSRKDTDQGGNIQGAPRDGVMGKYFSLKLKKCDVKEAWGWMGVYFEREKPLICLSFCNRKNWGKPIYDIIEANLRSFKDSDLSASPYKKTCYKETVAYWFEFMKDKEFDELSLEGQIQLLRNFFEEVIMSIYKIRMKED